MCRPPSAEFRNPRNDRGNTFLFSGCPESLHWGVVKAAPHAGHTLTYPGAFHFFSEGTTGILDAPVTVQQWFCVRIFLKRLLEGVQHKRCIIAAAQGERNDIPSVQIQHSTQVRLAAGAVFEFCYVSHPFFVLPPRRKVPVQNIFRGVFRRGSSSDTAAFSSCIQTAGQAHA